MKITQCLELEPLEEGFTPTNIDSMENVSLMAANRLIKAGGIYGLGIIVDFSAKLSSSPCFVETALGLADPGTSLADIQGDFNLQELCAICYLAGMHADAGTLDEIERWLIDQSLQEG